MAWRKKEARPHSLEERMAAIYDRLDHLETDVALLNDRAAQEERDLWKLSDPFAPGGWGIGNLDFTPRKGSESTIANAMATLVKATLRALTSLGKMILKGIQSKRGK